MTLDVANTGSREGADVVQLYATPPAASQPQEIRALCGFGRVHLKAGETRTITIDGVGTGTPVTVTYGSECAPGIDFTYQNDLRTPNLSGKWTQIIAGISTANVTDPDHLDQLSEGARAYFEEDVASGKIVILRF